MRICGWSEFAVGEKVNTGDRLSIDGQTAGKFRIQVCICNDFGVEVLQNIPELIHQRKCQGKFLVRIYERKRNGVRWKSKTDDDRCTRRARRRCIVVECLVTRITKLN